MDFYDKVTFEMEELVMTNLLERLLEVIQLKNGLMSNFDYF